jgi:serine/threonine-protein kinase
MPICATCGSDISGASHFCSDCGAALLADQMITLDAVSPSPAQPPRSKTPSAAKTPNFAVSSPSQGRFLPGRLLAGRYRIIALLGQGGMGEVYRADDLTLGQPVALKFLMEDATQDASILERFRNEVRMSLRVSHPNVCRVYDVGEVDGHTFFTMEYVDGEDLASLLRRIGRLPADKALEIARQLCAGLAAAHAKGVLHRDLKPANIMLDGRGQVVITDFGLSGLIDHIPGSDVRSGTPAYMAPEQLEGTEVNLKSDIYSLGLVLYEIFTGKRAFTSESRPGLARTLRDGPPSKPSSLVKDLDPGVERVILRCLELEPDARPASVNSIAAALPGGDPLAAALAAGETPSPQMVAAAGENAGVKPTTAMICFAIVVFGLLANSYLNVRTSGVERLALDQSPEVLSQKAREIIGRLGYEERPVDSAAVLFYNEDFLAYVQKTDKPNPNWAAVFSGRPSLLEFLYRQSPQYMVSTGIHDILLTPGIITQYDPPPIFSGMVNLVLDAQGRLMSLEVMPPQTTDAAPPPRTIDWNLLLAAAALDPAQLKPAEPKWTSFAASDARAAWTGTWPGTNWPLRVEAAAFAGKPVFFSLIGPWTRPDRMQPQPETPGQRASNLLLLGLVILVSLGAAWLARRNYIRGRGDRRGAFRLACMVFAVVVAIWFCRGHFFLGLDILLPFVLVVSVSLFYSGLIWLLYLSLEPYVRRHWPQTIVSWSRLLMGRWRDPLIGRDLLFGVILGVIWISIVQLRNLVMMRMGAPPMLHQTEYLQGIRPAFGVWLTQITGSIQGTLLFFFLLLVLRVVLRKQWLAGVVFVGIWVAIKSLGSDYLWVDLPAWTLLYGIAAVVVLRFGLLSLAAGIFATDLLLNVPLSFNFSNWYASTVVFPLLSVIALAAWGFYHALAGQKLWQADPFQ